MFAISNQALLGPCVGLVSPEDYKEDVNNSIRFLQGDTKELNQELIAKMEQAAADLEFEKAVFYRDRLSLLREVQAQQAVFKVKGEADIFSNCLSGWCDMCADYACTRNGRMLGG